MRARGTIVLGSQKTAHVGVQSEDFEEITRDHLGARAFRVAAESHVDWRGEPANHTIEHRVMRREIAIHRVGKRIGPGNQSHVGPDGFELDQAIGFVHAQRTNQNLIEQRKDSRIRANAQCQ